MKKTRKTYHSLDQRTFLDKKTGPWCQLDNSNWFVKKYQGKMQFYLNMADSKYQAMPEACFESTFTNSKKYNEKEIRQQISKFVEEHHAS